jgi:phosphinothricin acetyltransferase
MQIRLAQPGDAEPIRAIYNAEVIGGTNTFDLTPRTAEEQAAWLEEHRGAYPAVVAVAGDGTVAGFGSISAYRDRPAYATTVENSVYVDPRHRGQGTGKAILDELITLAAGHGFHAMIARIVGENEVSIGLHRACGFTLVGVEREVGRKHGRWLDVVELQRQL